MFWWGGYWSEVVNQVVFIIYITCAHTYAWWCTHVCSGGVKGWCCSRLMGFCCGWVQGHWGSSHQIPTDAGCSSGHALQIHTKSCLWATNLSLTHTKHRQKERWSSGYKEIPLREKILSRRSSIQHQVHVLHIHSFISLCLLHFLTRLDKVESNGETCIFKNKTNVSEHISKNQNIGICCESVWVRERRH